MDHDGSFIHFDDEFDESDRLQGPIEEDKKEVRPKVWRRAGNGAWEGERGLDQNYDENFTGAGLYLSRLRSKKRLRSFEEADLIRAYRAGDKSAGDQLIESLLWLVRGIAGNQEKHGKLIYGRAFYGPSFDDKVAAGLAGLVSAIERYDFSRNTRLSTYAVYWIAKSIGEECQRWRYRGMGGQTRADRYLFSHSGASAEEIVAKVHCSLKSAQQAIERLEMTELPAEEYRGVPCYRGKGVKPLSAGRKRDRIDDLAIEADRRAWLHLKEIGRRAYALELVAKDQKRKPAVYSDHLFWGRCRLEESLIKKLEHDNDQAVRPAPAKQRKCHG